MSFVSYWLESLNVSLSKAQNVFIQVYILLMTEICFRVKSIMLLFEISLNYFHHLQHPVFSSLHFHVLIKTLMSGSWEWNSCHSYLSSLKILCMWLLLRKLYSVKETMRNLNNTEKVIQILKKQKVVTF